MTILTLGCATPGEQDDRGEPPTVSNPEPRPIVGIWDGVYTAVQADRGAAIYTQQCASCHLDDLSGHEMAPGLAGVAFSFRWRGSTLQDLFDSLRLTMPQASPGSLPREDYLDLIAFLLEANDYPDGASELVEDGLPRIAIERKPK